MLLRWGFCFAKSQTDYSKIAKILDNGLLLNIAKIIVEHYKAYNLSVSTVWIQLICAAVRNYDLERIIYIQ